MTQKNVGAPHPHSSAVAHVTGQAIYLDDHPRCAGELAVKFVTSPVASGTIQQMAGISEARLAEGVAGVYTFEDIPGENRFGALTSDEPILAEGKVLYVGQPILIVAGENLEQVTRATELVRPIVSEEQPVLSIERAVELGHFYDDIRTISRGRAGEAIADATHQLSGSFFSGGQEQFPFEPQSCIAYPDGVNCVKIISSTQHPSEIQHVVASALGIPMSQVTVICERMGGAFGAKETQAAIPAVAAALVAFKTGRVARVVYSRSEDMCMTGKRHPVSTEWQLGFDDQGVVQGYSVLNHSDGGAARDLSPAVLERCMLHSTGAYDFPDVLIQGQVCITNKPPNTAFRGFGGPQGLANAESRMHDIAEHLGIDPLDVRLRNLYGRTGRDPETPYGQKFIGNNLPAIFETLERSSDYRSRVEEVVAHNSRDPLTLRGIALSGLMFGISFTARHLNQANANVLLFTDGTIQFSTGGTEMGQGLETTVQAFIADAFGLSMDMVRATATSTDKNNNTSPTAASSSKDLNSEAAQNACDEIRGRLSEHAAACFAEPDAGFAASAEHVRYENGEVFDTRNDSKRMSFAELCKSAYLARVNLGARGFFATPGVDFNRETGKGNPFRYFTQGAACAEVEICRHFGTVTVKRVDILIDLGKPDNPAIERGQVIGGFVQGMGWVTNECLVYDENGTLLTDGPDTYKIPSIADIPAEFTVELFEPSEEDMAREASDGAKRRSKAAGEPPFLLGIAVWCAIRQALSCMSTESSRALQIPATAEKVLCCLELAQQESPVS